MALANNPVEKRFQDLCENAPDIDVPEDRKRVIFAIGYLHGLHDTNSVHEQAAKQGKDVDQFLRLMALAAAEVSQVADIGDLLTELKPKP